MNATLVVPERLAITETEAAGLIKCAHGGYSLLLPWGSTSGLWLTTNQRDQHWAVAAVLVSRFAMRVVRGTGQW